MKKISWRLIGAHICASLGWILYMLILYPVGLIGGFLNKLLSILIKFITRRTFVYTDILDDTWDTMVIATCMIFKEGLMRELYRNTILEIMKKDC